MFYVCGGFTLFGAIVFGGFAKTDTEPWAKDPDDDKLDDVTKTELNTESMNSKTWKSFSNKGLENDDVVDTKL